MRSPHRCRRRGRGGAAGAAAAGARRGAELPARRPIPARSRRKPKGPYKTLHGLQEAALRASARSRRPSTRPRPATRSRSAERHLQGGRAGSAAPRSATSRSSATRRRRRKVVLEGKGPSKRQNGVFVNGADEVTVARLRRRSNYKANGFFFVNVVGYTAQRPGRRAHAACTASTPSTRRAARCATRGVLQQRRGLLHRADAAAGQADPLDRHATSSPTATRSAGRGTNMRYVTITKSRFYNNAAGHRPERAGLGEVPARRGQRHHRQRHLLEQLQLPPGRAVQDPRGRTSRRSCPVGTGVLLLGGRRNTRREQPHLRQLPGRRRRWSRASCSKPKNPEARRPRRQPGAPATRSASDGDRPQRPRHRLRRQRHGQLLRSGNTGVAVTIPADSSTLRRCPFTGANAFNQDAH